MKHQNRLQFNTILVATDLSEAGSTALRYAQAIALMHKSVLVVVHVIDPVSYAFPEGVPNSATADQAARDELKGIEEETRRQGIPIHSVVETGVVYERILQAVRDHNADLLVVGTRAKIGTAGGPGNGCETAIGEGSVSGAHRATRRGCATSLGGPVAPCACGDRFLRRLSRP